MRCSIRKKSGWVKRLLVTFTVALAWLALGSIRKEVHVHSDRLQRAQHNDSIRSQGMLKRMDNMDADIKRLSESSQVWLQSLRSSSQL